MIPLQSKASCEVAVISGFDATASAGILLDSHITTILGCQPLCILPAFSIQRHHSLERTIAFSEEEILLQLRNVKHFPKTIKIGLLQNKEAIVTISKFLKSQNNVTIIADTPIVSSSGKQLVDDITSYISAFKEYLLPIVDLLTPNTDEMRLFGGIDGILYTGCKAVLVKGGHSNGDECTDTLFTHNENKKYTTSRINFSENIRGTGCGFATAIACYLARGLLLDEAIRCAKEFILSGIKNSIKVDERTRVMNFIPPFPH